MDKRTLKNAVYLSVNVFSTIYLYILTGDTILTSPREGTAILRGHRSHGMV